MPVCPLTGGLISHWFIKSRKQQLRRFGSPTALPCILRQATPQGTKTRYRFAIA